MRDTPDIAPGTSAHRHDPRVRRLPEGACRKCYGTHWISIERGSIGQPIISADERAIPCDRCNAEGDLPHEPLTSCEDQTA